MTEEIAIEMFVGGLVLDPNTQHPVVVLKNEAGDMHLPIWIGIAEATSIASAIKQVNMARPLTHDLISEIFSQVGVVVERVVITDLKDSTYYAELVLTHGDKAIILDSRPSDAIAVAVRASAPIYVAQKVLDQAKVTLSGGGPAQAGGSDEPQTEGEAAQESDEQDRDFKNIDKDKWNEILKSLDPDDFKYKM